MFLYTLLLSPQFISLVFSFPVLGEREREHSCARVWGIFAGSVFLRHPLGCCWRHARIPFDKGRRSSGPIIQTSRRGREDRRDGVSKATCSPSARSRTLRPSSQSKRSTAKRKRVGRERREARGKGREMETRCYLFIPCSCSTARSPLNTLDKLE